LALDGPFYPQNGFCSGFGWWLPPSSVTLRPLALRPSSPSGFLPHIVRFPPQGCRPISLAGIVPRHKVSSTLPLAAFLHTSRVFIPNTAIKPQLLRSATWEFGFLGSRRKATARDAPPLPRSPCWDQYTPSIGSNAHRFPQLWCDNDLPKRLAGVAFSDCMAGPFVWL